MIVEEPIGIMNIVLLIFFMVIIVSLILVILYLYRNYVIPVKEIKQAAQKIHEGDFSTRIYIKQRNEVGQICALINKISDRYQASFQKYDDKAKELERCTKSLDNFAYVVSHDLKAPFNSIKSIAELLRLEYMDKFDDEGKELLNFIDIKVNEMDRLLMGILQYSRVRQSEEAVTSIDMNQEVQEILGNMNMPAHVQVRIKNDLPKIHMEKDLIDKVLHNLIENAVRYMDKPEGQIEIGSDQGDKYYTFYVSDNGTGIDARYFDKLFNIFYTVQSNTDIEPGAGVGLAIVKKIIEYKGGDLWLDSEPKKGSTFYFTLPVNGHHK